jgi:hypothetical protein
MAPNLLIRNNLGFDIGDSRQRSTWLPTLISVDRAAKKLQYSACLNDLTLNPHSSQGELLRAAIQAALYHSLLSNGRIN